MRTALMLAAFLTATAVAAPRDADPARWVSGVPDVMQMNDYSCGVACTQAIAQRHGHWGYQAEWAKELGTTSTDGTHPLKIVKVLKDLGLNASLREHVTFEELRGLVDRGESVIVDFQAWADDTGRSHRSHTPSAHPHDYANEWESGHYGVLVGYSATHVYIEDPSLLGSIGTLPIADFVARWHDYETEDGHRREYVHAAIIVTDPPAAPPAFTPIE